MNELDEGMTEEWKDNVRDNIQKLGSGSLMGTLLAFKTNEMFGKNTPEDRWIMMELHKEVSRRGVK